MTNDELIEKIAQEYDKIPSHYGNLQRRREIGKRVLSALGLLDGTNMLIPGWRDISEAPKDGEHLAVWDGSCDVVSWGRYTSDEFAWLTGSGDYWPATHFIPLDSIPTPTEKANG